MRRRLTIITGLFLMTSFAGVGQNLPYKAGFKIISTSDSSRIYKPNSKIQDKLHFRPIDIDLWYPADINSSDSTASFGDFVNLLELRSNFYEDTKKYSGIGDELLQYICSGYDCPDYNILKTLKTESYLNANPVNQKFPLVVYLSAYNGMSYENYLLFESLAKQGFIVASVSSVGRYPGNMSMDIPDLFEQVNDAKFIIGHLAKKELVTDDIGLVGYSWGGLAASIMAMAEPEKFKALVSLDGSEQFSYGDSFDNEKLNHIRGLNLFKPEKIKSSYLYLDSDLNETDIYPDSIYNITKFVSSDKYYLRIKGTKHEDFSCISYISNTADSTNRYRLIRQLTVSYLQEKIKHQKMFLKNIPPEMVENQFTPQTRRRDSDAGEQMISGFITDKKSNQPLQYVNVGLMNKDKGTTTLKNGAFKLNLSESNLEDTLKISMVGYAPRTFYLKDLLKGPQSHLNIQLKEKTEELKEVVVTRNKLTTRVLGNKTESRFFGGKFASKDLGSEIAIKIKIRKAPTHLNKFTFNVSYNTTDTSTFRVNVYTVKNGLPDKNVLSKNLIKRIAKQTGKIELDLSKQNIVVNDDFFISLEWIEGNKNSGVTFSSGFVNKGTYYRKASQGLWKKYPMGVGFNVTASY